MCQLRVRLCHWEIFGANVSKGAIGPLRVLGCECPIRGCGCAIESFLVQMFHFKSSLAWGMEVPLHACQLWAWLDDFVGLGEKVVLKTGYLYSLLVIYRVSTADSLLTYGVFSVMCWVWLWTTIVILIYMRIGWHCPWVISNKHLVTYF